ncbi:MAG TPA: haloalkane dehalogenase [Burkholderiales bacterium]|nr:haloalkane dehalogenase [Burkholderiales bacterium]
MNEILRTPEARFAKLPGFDYQPRYLDWRGMRIHYVDEQPVPGADAARTFLCLHGEPTWSYLYRKMIPPFLASGARVVAPDLPGFGRSDKPSDDAVYSFDFHRGFLLDFVERLDLKNVTLVVQDWGGILGLTLPMEAPVRYARLLVMNTALGTGDEPLTDGFLAWRAYVAKNPNMDCGRLLARACPVLTPDEAAAYEAPFPGAAYKGGVRRFPQLVPDAPDAPGAEISRRARDWWRTVWRGDAFMAIGATDPVLGLEPMRALHAQIRGCAEPWIHSEAGHFVQEWGSEVARAALAHWGAA